MKKRGKNYFGVCPFHDDTNPSMSVSREKQIYTCFSCHATGNVFTFLMNYEHKEFNQVLSELANRVGITLNGFKTKKISTNMMNGIRYMILLINIIKIIYLLKKEKGQGNI